MFGRRVTVALAAPIAVLALVAGVLVVTHHGPTRVERARKLAADDARFVTAKESGVTFVKISRLLRDEGEACLRRPPAGAAGATAAKCARFFAASAYAQVSAVRILQCTRPGVFDARAAMRGYLAALAAGGGRDPDVPRAVACR